jgi:hypothetical protein
MNLLLLWIYYYYEFIIMNLLLWIYYYYEFIIMNLLFIYSLFWKTWLSLAI